MKIISSCLLLMTVTVSCLSAVDAPLSQTFIIPKPDNGFTANFGAQKPGSTMTVIVTPSSGCTITAKVEAGSDNTWVGGPTFTGTIPMDWSGKHVGKFGGTYSCPGGSGDGGEPPVWTGGAVAELFTITSRTSFVAVGNSSRSRETVGICEEVVFSVNPPDATVTWSATGGLIGPEIGVSTKWTAPIAPGHYDITANVNGHSCSINMGVLIPAGISSVKTIGSEGITSDPKQVGSGMLLTLTVLPTSVSFGGVELKEDAIEPSNLQGTFNNGTVPLNHTAENGAESWDWVGEDNAQIVDRAVYYFPLAGEPEQSGSFEWSIPVRYRCLMHPDNGVSFMNTKQIFTFTVPRTMKVEKHGQMDVRTATP